MVLSKDEVIRSAQETLEIEGRAVLDLASRIGDSFCRAIEMLAKCKGRVVLTGMGKAGIIAQKCSATLSSTGTPSLWLHIAEAVHGDLGRVTKDDVVIVLSYSGESDEVRAALPFLKKIGPRLIALTGNARSTLARYSDELLDISVQREACPLGLAPTSSTTVMLALCDAIAVALQKAKGFNAKDFARFHPKGSLGRKLLLTVEDCMRSGRRNPTVHGDTTVGDALVRITKVRAGACLIVDKDRRLLGIFTDGDLRRHLGTDPELTKRPISDVMTPNPITVAKGMLATEALRILEEQKVDEAPVVDKNNKVLGLLDVQDLLKAGVV